METKIVNLERCSAFMKIPKEEHYFNFEHSKKLLIEDIDKPLWKFIPKKNY